MSAHARTDSGSRVPMARADSIRPGDSLVESDGAMIEVERVEVTSYFVTLTFRPFGVSRTRPKFARLDEMLACIRGKADPLAIATAALHQLAAWSEGPEVDGTFEAPNAARVARRALAQMGITGAES